VGHDVVRTAVLGSGRPACDAVRSLWWVRLLYFAPGAETPPSAYALWVMAHGLAVAGQYALGYGYDPLSRMTSVADGGQAPALIQET
jgi:hypothetical protein